MRKQIVLFVAMFAVGALAALITRTVLHKPYDVVSHSAEPNTMPHNMAEHATAPPTKTETVNTICPICGMPVDPTLPTAEYAGKSVGFGCKACVPKFAKDPQQYGPAALQNQEVE
ncbi:MAG: hypothetical protein O3B24_02465 [Verrucomicrobia bacterium]|nr:hypothetical protein [Verrucomicrobiota bacterium]